MHGHGYIAEITVKGNLIAISGSTDEGMVVDFGDIKEIANKYIPDVLDHGFIVWGKDEILVKLIKLTKIKNTS